MREVPKTLITTLISKGRGGTGVMTLPNGKNIKDIWIIRSQVQSFRVISEESCMQFRD